MISALTPEDWSGRSVAVVCHDAGGAELVSRFARHFEWSVSPVIEGPAVPIFARVLGRQDSMELATAIEGCDAVITGTGWQTNLERSAIQVARVSSKPVISVLDHWVNYERRFGNSLPDALWVTDLDALRQARHVFPSTPAVLLPNLHVEEFLQEVAGYENQRRQQSPGDRVLIACEPISVHYGSVDGNPTQLGYDEWDALTFFFENMSLVCSPSTHVVIRPHPSERLEKYQPLVERYSSTSIVVTKTCSISEAIAQSTIVAGCESMALVLGLAAGRRVVSIIPPHGMRCRLPHSDIVSLAGLLT